MEGDAGVSNWAGTSLDPGSQPPGGTLRRARCEYLVSSPHLAHTLTGGSRERGVTEEGTNVTGHTPRSLARAVRWSAAIVAAVAVGAIGLTGTALANFPHYKTASVTTVAPAADSASLTSAQTTTALPDLLFTWTEVGLGNNISVTYKIQSDVTATFGCVNNGSNHPNATNKTTVTEPVTTTASLTSDKNGNVSGSVELDTSSVSPPSGFSCPQGQTEEALSATFAGNTVTDTTNNVSAKLGDIVVTLGP